MNEIYHLMDMHTYMMVPSTEALSLCGLNMYIDGHRESVLPYRTVRHRFTGSEHAATAHMAGCPECLAHPKLALYILEETEL